MTKQHDVNKTPETETHEQAAPKKGVRVRTNARAGGICWDRYLNNFTRDYNE
jgi:hypothetical protein